MMEVKWSPGFGGCWFAGALALMVIGAISLPVDAGAAADAVSGWQGAYGGVHLGYGWGKGDTRVDPLPDAATFINLAPTKQSPNPSGVLGGVQLGYNWPMNPVVLGIETGVSFSGMDGTKVVSPIIQNDGTPFPGAGNNLTVSQKTDWFGTLRLRLGFAPVSGTLLYGTGGMAYGSVKYSANTNFLPVGTEQYPASFSKTKVGWTVGAGAEFVLSGRWTAKAEYLYYDLGSESTTIDASPSLPPFQIRYKWDTTAHTLNAGLNYKF